MQHVSTPNVPSLLASRIDIGQKPLERQIDSCQPESPRELRNCIYEFSLGGPGQLISLKLAASQSYVVSSARYEAVDDAVGRPNIRCSRRRHPHRATAIVPASEPRSAADNAPAQYLPFHAKELNTMVLDALGQYCLQNIRSVYLHSDYCGIGDTRHWLDSVPSWLDAIPLLQQMRLESLVFMFEFGWVERRCPGGGTSMWSASGTSLHSYIMSTILPPPMRRSKPAKTRSVKPSAPPTAPAAPIFDEDIGLRKFALKRCSLEWAAESLSTIAPELTATTPAPPAPSEPALSEPPRRRSSLKKTPRLSFQRTMTESVTSTLSMLELPENDTTRAITRASSESTLELACSRRCFNSRARRSSNGSLSSTTSTDSSSSARSRSASLSSVSSTESESEPNSKRLSLRAIPRLCLSTIVGLCIEFKTAMIPGPTPEDLLTIPPIPLMRMRDKPRRRPHPAFQSLTSGEKRIRFLCPQRECRDPLWPDYEETLPEEE
ncbi:hypothetical protein DFH09DRAFT_1377809 [Mycena vulgaris]|nr:hypothetical protein DFH09DRAFT_1377809 [Mycena vulgaris]